MRCRTFFNFGGLFRRDEIGGLFRWDEIGGLLRRDEIGGVELGYSERQKRKMSDIAFENVSSLLK